MIQVDLRFFQGLVHMLETNNNIVRPLPNVTEAWVFTVDQTLMQCKEIIRDEQEVEKKAAIVSDFFDIDFIPENLIFKTREKDFFDEEQEG